MDMVKRDMDTRKQQETVLVIDDEAVIRRLLCQKLSSEGYSCKEADTAEEVFNKLRNGPTGLVILDIKMPGKSGIELLPEIKAAYPDTAVIMATAVTELSVAIQCIKNGADDYICKPFNLDEVSLSVRGALEKRELQLKIREYQHHLEEKIEEQTREIRKLFLGAIEALVFALDYLDPTVRDASDAERTLGLPILGEIPNNTAGRGAAAPAS